MTIRPNDLEPAEEKALPVMVAVLTVPAIGWVDWLTGPYLALSVFYVISIFLAGWYGGKASGYLVAGLSAVTGLAADLAIHGTSHSILPYWNASSRLVLFLVLANILLRLRKGMHRERCLAEKERAAANRLRELDELKDTFLQTVAHDLRDPLSGILGSALTLSRDAPTLPLEDKQWLAEGIVSLSRKLIRLVVDLLDVERIKQGILYPQPRAVDVGALTRSIVDASRPRGRPVIVDAPSLIVVVDPVSIERIIENLLANAATHTPMGTRVWVRVEWDEGLVITVEDDGPGIADDVADRLFEPFSRGSSEATPGAGMGLYIVARFAELNGGKVWAQKREGGGASFRVFLPENAQRAPFDDELGAPSPDIRTQPGAS
jgi:signal transduction histidine kinase